MPCHAPNGVGTLDFTRSAEVQGRRERIAEETRAGRMPPWLPDERACAKLHAPRRLTAPEIDDLAEWAKAGGPVDDTARVEPRIAATDAAHAPDTRSAWRGADASRLLRKLTATAPYAPTRGDPSHPRRDDYRCFVLEPSLDAPADVTGFRVLPTAPSIVHHVIVFEVREAAVPALLRLDASDPGPGYPCFGGIGVDPQYERAPAGAKEKMHFQMQLVAGWAPGGNGSGTTIFPRDTAVHLARGSRLVVQIHYNLAHLEPNMTDHTAVELYGGAEREPRQAFWVPVLDTRFRVPAGTAPDDARAIVNGALTLPVRAEVFGVAPHMHLRGVSARIDSHDQSQDEDNLSPQDGDRCLLDVPQWDFDHQEMYWLEETQLLNQAKIRCRFDARGPRAPDGGALGRAHDLTWGEGTDDEMCLAFLYAVF